MSTNANKNDLYTREEIEAAIRTSIEKDDPERELTEKDVERIAALHPVLGYLGTGKIQTARRYLQLLQSLGLV